MKKKAYMVATAHLDTVWRWSLATTIDEYIANTLYKNFDLIEKYPDYKFNFEGAYRYELMEEYYPEEFERVNEYIAEGRWCPCGSAYENGDVNVPSPEALFRNILYGNNYFKEKLGVKTNDIYLPDCFGFGYALPSIMKHAQLKGFTTQKLTWGSANGVPFDIGYWQGVDGERVYGAINCQPYDAGIKSELRGHKKLNEKLNSNIFKYSFPKTMMFYGTGDKGGASDERSVMILEKDIAKNDDDELEIYSASAQDLFNDLDNETDEIKNNLPIYDGELVMTAHGAGSYTSRTMAKRLNAKNEDLAGMAEKACVTADALGVYDYPAENLRKAWKRVIKHQFHDDITGTSLMEIYNDGHNDYFVSLHQFEDEYKGAVGAIANELDTSWVTECAMIVNNSACYDRSDAVSAHVKLHHNCKFVKVLDKSGNEMASQIVKKTGKEFDIIFMADVKSLGYKVFDVVPSDKPCKIKTDLTVTQHTLENKKYKVLFNKNGDIASVFDKINNKQILEKPIKMALLNDIGSIQYPSWEIAKNDIVKGSVCYANTPFFEIIDNGPARVSLKITREADYSIITQTVSLTSESKFISVHNYVDWQTRRRMLKAVFPFAYSGKKATYDLGLGVIKRGINTEKLYEVPAQKWADISADNNSFGVSVFSDCKYGWDRPTENTLRLTCIHTPSAAFNKDSRQDLQDIGRNIFTFGICSHSGGYESETQVQNELFQKPLVAFQTNAKSGGKLGDEFSFASISDSAIIRSIKKAEDENGYIIRINESNGKSVDEVKINFFNEIESAEEIFASEEFKANAQFNKNKLTFSLKPFEVKSFRVSFKNDYISIANECTPIELEYNVKGFTSNDNKRNVILQGSGCSLPAELCEGKLTAGGIKYKLPDTGAMFDVMTARAQKIEIPNGTNKICLLASSTLGDREAIFSVDGIERSITIHSMTEYIAQWDMFGLRQTAYTKNASPALEFTHTHHPEGDIANGKAYFFTYEINCKNAKELTLPEDSRIVILAITAVKYKSETTLATEIIDTINSDGYEFGKVPPMETTIDKTTDAVLSVDKFFSDIDLLGKAKNLASKGSLSAHKFINKYKRKY